MLEILAQIFGWIALPVAIVRFQFAKLTHMLIANGLASLLIGLSYLFQGLIPGASMAIAACFTSLLQAAIGQKLSLLWRIGLATPAICFCLYLFMISTSGLPILPVIAFFIGRISETVKNDLFYRLISITSTSIWLIYLYIEWSIPGIMFETITLLSNIMGIVRFHFLNGPKQIK